MADEFQQQMAKIEIELADSALYQESGQNRLQVLIGKRDKVQKQLSMTEEEWLQVVGSLEGFDAC